MTPETPSQQQVMSPEMSAYAGTSFSLNSGESIVARSASSQPTFNVAISRWFDMLVGDSVFENGIPDVEFGMDDGQNVETPRETPREYNRTNSIPYMGSFQGSTPDASGYQAASPCSSSSPQLLERNPPMISAASEKLRWQAPAPIELLPYELFIFQNFVQRISLWVSFLLEF